MNQIGIDILTEDATKLIRKLNRLESSYAQDRGVYREDARYTKVYVETELTVMELEDWLYHSGINYVGTFIFD